MRTSGTSLALAMTVAAFVCVLANESKGEEGNGLNTWWTFDALQQGPQEDQLDGNLDLVKGVSGNCLKFDGFTARVIRNADRATPLGRAFTFEAWIAPQEYAWNQAPIINSEGECPLDPSLALIHGTTTKPSGLATNVAASSSGGRIADFSTTLDATGEGWGKPANAIDGNLQTTWYSLHEGNDAWIAIATAGAARITHIGYKNHAPDASGQYLVNRFRVTFSDGSSQLCIVDPASKTALQYFDIKDVTTTFLLWESSDTTGDNTGATEIQAYGEIVPDTESPTLEPVTSETIFRKDRKHGYFFGIDHVGHLLFRANMGGKWQTCTSIETLPLLRWSHVAASFDSEQGMAVYIDGKPVGRNEVKGELIPAKDTDIWIGMGHTKQPAAGDTRKDSRSWMVFDGLIDEVKIHNRALTADEVRRAFASIKPAEAQPLEYRRMPSGPKEAKSFGAFYTRLRYAPEWERNWRVGDHADVLIPFDEIPVRLIFWRGTGYSPAWVTDNDKWVSDQSAESFNQYGCCEHMSDKRCQYSHVRIIENTDARSVVHWRVASSDKVYGFNHVDPYTGWGEWSDEYYYIYPDGVAVRYQEIHSTWAKNMEWQQSEILNQPGTRPQDNVEEKGITVVDMDGNCTDWIWDTVPCRKLPSAKDVTGPIQVINLKSKYRHFVIGEKGARWVPWGAAGTVRGFSNMSCWNHWPVALLPNDGRTAEASDRPSATCLGTLYPVKHKGEGVTMIGRNLYGMTDKEPGELAVLARSWNFPAQVKVAPGNFTSEGYDKNQRAYVFSCSGDGPLKMTLDASANSPVLNPAFVIRNWGDRGAELKINAKDVKQGKVFRCGRRRTLEGSDLIIWVKTESTKPMEIAIKPVRS